jgi:hypothetical protein
VLGDMGACGSKEAAAAVVVTAEGNTTVSPAAPPSNSVKLAAPLPPPEAQPHTSTADGGADLGVELGAGEGEDKDTVTPVSSCELFCRYLLRSFCGHSRSAHRSLDIKRSYSSRHFSAGACVEPLVQDEGSPSAP